MDAAHAAGMYSRAIEAAYAGRAFTPNASAVLPALRVSLTQLMDRFEELHQVRRLCVFSVGRFVGVPCACCRRADNRKLRA